MATQVFAPADPTPRTNQPPSPIPTGATPVDIAAPPTLSDMELIGRLRALFARARSERKPFTMQWNKNHRIMRNRTWLSTRPDWMPQPEVPEIRPTIGQCVAWVTDQRPQFDLVPAAAPFSQFSQFFQQLAMDMKTAMNAAWQTNLYEKAIETVVWDAYQYDVGFVKVVWNPALADGLGDVDVLRVDPYTLYVDPAATSLADANYIIEARTISLQELDRKYPGAAAKFGDLNGYREMLDEMPRVRLGSGQVPRANPGAIAPATSARYGLPGQSRERASAQNDDSGVTLLECWLREHYTAERGGQTRVYECWRCVSIAGPHVLLNKRANEILPFTRHPYVRFCPEDLGELYGQSMVELLAPSQISVNRLLASMQHNIDLVGNPVFVEETRAGISRTKITNRPGQRVPIAAGAKADWLTPPSLMPLMPDLVKFYIGEMERISGLSSIAKGVAPGGRLASDVLDTVMEAGFVRIRLAQRNLEFALREVGVMMASIIAEFYTEPRFISIVGPGGQNTAQVLRGRHFYLPTEQGAVPLRFQVLVRAGSMLPTSRGARVAEIDTLYAMGGVDRPVLLEAHDVPNWQQIADRIGEQEAKGTFNPPGARQRARH